MGRRAKAVITAILIILIFAFAPWLNDREIHERVLKEKGRLDHTIDEDGRLICDYKVNWAPFEIDVRLSSRAEQLAAAKYSRPEFNERR